MKKIFFVLLIVLFVSTLFIGCPPRVPNPPQPPTDTIPNDSNYNDSILPAPQDSLYEYISEDYLRSYFPFEIGTNFVYVNEIDSVVDTITLTVTYNDIKRAFKLQTAVIAHNDSSNKITSINKSIVDGRKKIGGFGDDDDVDSIFDDEYYPDDDYILSHMLENVNVGIKLEGDNIELTFVLDFGTTVTKENPYACMNKEYTFWFKETKFKNYVCTNCDCLSKDCLFYSCLTYTINLYDESDILYIEVERGKGITKFRDNNEVYWHLVE